jgi:hypothetical protein
MRSPISHPPAVEATGCREQESEPVTIREHVAAAPRRDSGRADLPVIGPHDSPRRVARRLV